jgi:hypothetical protein
LLDYPEVPFTIADLNKALEAMRGARARDADFEAGKVLFNRMFDQNEIDKGSLNGRRRPETGIKTIGFFTDDQLKPRSNAILGTRLYASTINNHIHQVGLIPHFCSAGVDCLIQPC